MYRIKVAELNIDFDCISTDFFDKRFAAYYREDNSPVDLMCSIELRDEISCLNGDIVLEEENIKVIEYEKDKFCKYLISPVTNNIIRANFYNKDFSQTKILVKKDETNLEFTLAEQEYLFTGIEFLLRLSYLGGCILHSSALSYNNQGILFSADSGVGKSTHTALWREYKDVVMVNDDKPAIRIIDDVPYLYGTPWSGKTDINNNIKVPLKAIVLIKRGDENKIRKVSVLEAFFKLTQQLPKPYFDANVGKKVIDVLEKIIGKIPIYELECTISKEAVDVVFNEIFGEEK